MELGCDNKKGIKSQTWYLSQGQYIFNEAQRRFICVD